MKKKVKTKQVSLFLWSALLMMLLSLPAYAREYKYTETIDRNNKEYLNFYDQNMRSIEKKFKSAYVINLSSGEQTNVRDIWVSDPSAASVTHYLSDGSISPEGGDMGYLVVKFNKDCKVTVKFSGEQFGYTETDHFTYNFTAIKYANPFKTFKIGKKDLTKAFAKKLRFDSRGIPSAARRFYQKSVFASTATKKIKKGLSGKLKIKLNKGWQVKQVYYKASKTAKAKTVKSNAKLKFADKNGNLTVVLRNTELHYFCIFSLAG